MKQRAIITNDYPESPFRIGDILEHDGEPDECWILNRTGRKYLNLEVACYPAIFRILSWWEHREEKEMPEYVRIIRDGSVWYVEGDIYDENAEEVELKFPPVGTVLKTSEHSWLVEQKYVYLIHKDNDRIEIHAIDFIPATETEYHQYINKKQ